MKDLSLSPLSRGCGHVITESAGDHGRLDVCFTPQDYYIWKSHDALLHLTNSGSLLRSQESTIPKTYSTRRGPLLLYSRDLVTLGTECRSQGPEKSRRITRQHTQEVDHRRDALNLHQQKDQLTWRFATPTLPPLPNIHRASVSRLYATREHHDPEFVGDPRESNSHLENPSKDENEIQGSDRRVRLDLVLDLQNSIDYITLEELQLNELHTKSSQHNEITDLTLVLNPNDATTVSRGSVIMVKPKTSVTRNNNRKDSFLPSLRAEPPVTPESYYQHPLAVGQEGSIIDEAPHNQGLPFIEDHHINVGYADGTRIPQTVQTEPAWVGFHSQACQKDSHHRHLILPLLLPFKKHEQMKCKKTAAGRDQTAKQFCEKILHHGQQSKTSSEVLLGLVEESQPLREGVSGCVTGCKGPGRQSSSAFLHNQIPDRHNSCDSNNAKRRVVRGVLPLELRDLQNGQAVGCVILGPDGEIIQLSLYDSYKHRLLGDGDDTEQQAFQVLSADGETLPCVMVLQHEHAHSEEDGELNVNIPSGDVEYCAPVKTCLDPHKSAESDIRPHSSHVNKVITANETIKKADPMEETRWEDKQDVKKQVVKPSPRVEEPAGGSTAEQDEKEFEHLPKASLEPIDQLANDMINTLESGFSTTSIQQDTVARKPSGEEAAVGLNKDSESNTTEEAAWGKNVKTVKSQEEPMRSRKNKATNLRKQKKEESDARLTKSNIDDKQTKKNATKTQKHSALTSVFQKKKRAINERENGDMRAKEANKVEKGKKDESTRKTRRTKLNHKDDGLNVPSHKQQDGGLGKEEVAAEQERGEGFYLKSPECFAETPKADTSIEEDNECLSTDDNHSTDNSVHSVSFQMSPSVSLGLNARSSLRSSCEGSSGDMRSLTPSRGQLPLSSCSTIMVTEEQLMLKLVKTEASKSNEKETRRRAEQVEIRRQEAERRRMEQEEEERMQQQASKRTKDNMRNELAEERRRRAEHVRLRKLAEEEVKRKREQEEQQRAGRELAEREKVRRRQEEKRRQMEQLQMRREEEARRRKVEVEHLHLEELRREEEECKLLQEMDEGERDEYHAMKAQEEERRTKEEEQPMREDERSLTAKEESGMQAELLSTQMTLLQQQMAFKKGLLLEAEGMGQTQRISRPWVYSYFTLLRLLDLNSTQPYETILS
ncbi:uncharacterized protein KIAA2012 homolog isoform X2 [Vanacampus margaritifer]